jgi:aarF domain-containing kinase
MFELVKGMKGVAVPRVIQELSTKEVLTMEMIKGIDLDTCAEKLSQEERNYVGEKIMDVTVREIFEWQFMQTDPNPGNFFYNPITKTVFLLDFGAARDYSDEFCKNYLDTVWGAANNDPELILEATTKLGFLSGDEAKVMVEAHIESIIIVGEPFAGPGKFDFGNQAMTQRIYKLMPVMLKNRLKAPPPEVYSLHRKLSGAYLINMNLKSKIDARKIFMDAHKRITHKHSNSAN